jgi:adenylylsulfate kinase
MAPDQSLPGSVTPGFALWLTGLPASGKTTLAYELHCQLAERGIQTVILDSDELRRVLTPNPTYRAEERDWFYNVLTYLAAWLVPSGVNVLIAATAHRRIYREAARAEIVRFAEIYVRCSLAACRQRDPKGIYALAQAGQAPNVPGVGSLFEPPTQPEATVDTEEQTPAEAAAFVLNQLTNLVL